MDQNLGKHAETWINLLLEEGFKLDEFFNVPDESIKDKLGFMVELAQTIWEKFNTLSELKDLDEILPCWIVFALPRRPAFILYSLWESLLRQNKVKLEKYLGLQSNKIIMNYLQDEIHLFKTIKPFRIVLGFPDSYGYVSTHKRDLRKEHELLLINFSSIESINDYFKKLCVNGTLETGMRGLLALEELSILISDPDEFEESITYFQEQLEEIKNTTQKNPKIQPVNVQKTAKNTYEKYLTDEYRKSHVVSTNFNELGSRFDISGKIFKTELSLAMFRDKIREIEEKIESLGDTKIDFVFDSISDNLDISFINLKTKLELLIFEEENKGNYEKKKHFNTILNKIDMLEQVKYRIVEKIKREREK